MTEHLTSVILETVIRSAENELIKNKWRSTPNNALHMRHTTPHVFLILRVLARHSVIVRLSHQGLRMFLRVICSPSHRKGNEGENTSKHYQRSQQDTFQ